MWKTDTAALCNYSRRCGDDLHYPLMTRGPQGSPGAAIIVYTYTLTISRDFKISEIRARLTKRTVKTSLLACASELPQTM